MWLICSYIDIYKLTIYSKYILTLNDDNFHYQNLKQQVDTAYTDKINLVIQGGGSKAFLGRICEGEILDTRSVTGIVAYEPTELFITARAGTPLSEIENVLAQENQCLAFDPPYFGESATFGGMIACGLSGPGRPYNGAVRDFMLGVKCLTGKGDVLTFGGQVIKNVAGYDVSRLMTGALGTLGIILEASIKVMPRPESEISLSKPADEAAAIRQMNTWAGNPLPISAACHENGCLNIRLSGTAMAVNLAKQKMNMDDHPDGLGYWQALREHRLAFFTDNDQPLWRISVPSTAESINLPGEWLIDWGGAQRWLKSNEPVNNVQQVVFKSGGHATLFRGGDRQGEIFQPLAPEMFVIHKRLKKVFDPENILNSGRIYKDL